MKNALHESKSPHTVSHKPREQGNSEFCVQGSSDVVQVFSHEWLTVMAYLLTCELFAAKLNATDEHMTGRSGKATG